MKNIIFLSAMIFTSSAFAHFELGTYKGKTLKNEVCAFTIVSVDFKDGIHHPLNENVKVIVHFMKDLEVQMQHLAIVDYNKGTVRPKKETLTSYWATSTGAGAIELYMSEEGPVQMRVFEDHYSTPQKNQQLDCIALKFQG